MTTVTPCPLRPLVFTSSSMSPRPHSHSPTPRAATTPSPRKCQHLLCCCDSFGLRSRSHVTTVENHCDWISKPTAGMVWLNDRGRRLTPCRQPQPNRSSAENVRRFHPRTAGFCVTSGFSSSPSYLRLLSHIRRTT